MTFSDWILWAALAALIIALALTALGKEKRHRPLSRFQPKTSSKAEEKVALGQEATDLDSVERIHKENQRIAAAHRSWANRSR